MGRFCDSTLELHKRSCLQKHRKGSLYRNAIKFIEWRLHFVNLRVCHYRRNASKMLPLGTYCNFYIQGCVMLRYQVSCTGTKCHTCKEEITINKQSVYILIYQILMLSLRSNDNDKRGSHTNNNLLSTLQ